MSEGSKKNNIDRNGLKHYLSASVLTTIAGLFTFPVLTRLLSKADYGIFSLIQSFQLIYEALLKGGIQFAVRRYYPLEFLNENETNRKTFISTVFLFPLLFSTVITFIVSICIVVFCYLTSSEYYWLLLVTSSAQASIVISYFRSYMQAAGLSKYDSIIDIVQKYLYLILVIPIVLYLSTNYLGVYWAIFISYCLMAALTIWLNRNIFSYFSINIDFKLLRSTLSYSFPFVLVELSALSISYVDRIILAIMEIPISDIGTYAIGFGLANVVFMLIWKILYPTIFPTVNKLYDFNGLEAARIFLGKSMSLILLLCIALVFGISLNYEEFIILVCGEDKADSGVIFLFATILFLIKVIDSFLYYGFDLLKRTKQIFYSELVVAVVNIILNILFIYLFGLYGALISSYLSVFIGIAFKYYVLPESYRITFSWEGFPVVICLLCMYLLTHCFILNIYIDNGVLKMALSIIIFVVIMLFNIRFWRSRINYVFRFDV